MSTKTPPSQSVPLSPEQAAQVRKIAEQRGISEDEAATELFQAGLAGLARPKRDKKPKVLKMRRGK